MAQVDRRKRKSCEKPPTEVKRSRFENESISQSKPENFDQSQVESPKSEDCSSSTTSTSGVDVTDSHGSGHGSGSSGCVGGSTPQVEHQNQVKNISNFVRFQPVDPKVPRQLKSSMKKKKVRTTTSATLSTPTQNGLDSDTHAKDESNPKPNSKSVHFDVVREFRFNRIQSFVSMPSYGGLSLGMGK